MSKRSTPPVAKTSTVAAGAAGASSGTLLVLLANNLPEANALKSWLVIAAPSLSLGIQWLWLKISSTMDTRNRKRTQGALFSQARVTLEKAIQNPLTSAEHKASLREKLEALEKLEIEAIEKELEVLQKA